MLIKSETIRRTIILSFVTIVSASSPPSSSRPPSRRYLENEPAIPITNIETNRCAKAIQRGVEPSPVPLRIDGSARRIFFWPFFPKWWLHKWWHKRPWAFGAGIYGGLGIGVGGGFGSTSYHRPPRPPAFGGGIGAGIAAGAAIGAGAGVIHSQPVYDKYQPQHHESFPANNYNGGYNDVQTETVTYPQFPPVPNDINSRQPIRPSNYDFSSPSAVGYDDRPDHVVGYDRAVYSSTGYNKNGYIKSAQPVGVENTDRGRYNSNYEMDYVDRQQDESYMTIDDDDSTKRVLQWYRDRHKKVPTGQTAFEDSHDYFIGRETNSYVRDDDRDENESLYDRDRYRDDSLVT